MPWVAAANPIDVPIFAGRYAPEAHFASGMAGIIRLPRRTGSATAVVGVPTKQNPPVRGYWGVLGVESLAMTYFHTGSPHYHRRGVVSRSCSGWEGVVPTRSGHQA